LSVPRGAFSSRKPCVSVQAAKAATKKKIGFRWDGANLRWVRDDRFADIAGDESKTLIKPKTGAAYMAWPVVHTTLKEAGLQSVSPEEADKLAKKGWTLVDVRQVNQFESEHAEGALNIPLYRYVQGNTFWDNAKRLAMAGFAMKATERNPEFVEDARKTLGSKNKKIILMCAVGGTLDTNVSYRREKKIFADPERQFGRESRSLKAAYELLEGGWSVNNMKHLEGGFQQWRYQGYPLVDGDE